MALIRQYEGITTANLYQKFRPSYPESVAKDIIDSLGSSERNLERKFHQMLDVGCGSGQATHLFASYFDSILGIDISQSQIEVAKETNKNENVSFQVVHDNFFPVEDNSVDLVICAMAIHWLDLETFISECKRVLKPDGHVAIFSYLFAAIRANQDETWDTNYPPCQFQFFKDCETHPRNFDYHDGYRSIFSRIAGMKKKWLPTEYVENHFPLAGYMELTSTVSAYKTFKQNHPEEKDPLQTFSDGIKKLLNMENSKEEDVEFFMKTEFPIIILSSPESRETESVNG